MTQFDTLAGSLGVLLRTFYAPRPWFHLSFQYIPKLYAWHEIIMVKSGKSQ